jgi:hypothetical protein
VELGITENRRYLKRALVFMGSLRLLWQHRRQLAEALQGPGAQAPA